MQVILDRVMAIAGLPCPPNLSRMSVKAAVCMTELCPFLSFDSSQLLTVRHRKVIFGSSSSSLLLLFMLHPLLSLFLLIRKHARFLLSHFWT